MPAAVFDRASSSDKFGSNGFVVGRSCGGAGGLAGGKSGLVVSLSGSVEPAFNHFHLLDRGWRCSGGLWFTEVICDVCEVCDACVSIRSEMVSSLSRCLFAGGAGSCSSCRADADAPSVFGNEDESSGSALGGWTTVSGMAGKAGCCDWLGGLAPGPAEPGGVGLLWEAARFS